MSPVTTAFRDVRAVDEVIWAATWSGNGRRDMTGVTWRSVKRLEAQKRIRVVQGGVEKIKTQCRERRGC